MDVNFSAYRTMIPLKDGSLYSLVIESADSRRPWVTTTKRSISSDAGATWSKPEPMLDTQGREIRLENNNESLLRLKSGALGLVFARNEDGEAGREAPPAKEYGVNVWFSRSADEGRTWSKPIRVGEPSNKPWKYWNSAIVTTKGRIVVPVFSLIGKTVPERGRALLGDHMVGVGHHGYEQFLTYSWVYYSDDEGETWKPNQGKSIWAAGGELFVTLDDSAGGHYGCDEPVVEEVSPDHLLPRAFLSILVSG
jgi:Neuraminidase (sialidase)